MGSARVFARGPHAVSLIYPNGQPWTVTNEAGGCALAEALPRIASCY